MTGTYGIDKGGELRRIFTRSQAATRSGSDQGLIAIQRRPQSRHCVSAVSRRQLGAVPVQVHQQQRYRGWGHAGDATGLAHRIGAGTGEFLQHLSG